MATNGESKSISLTVEEKTLSFEEIIYLKKEEANIKILESDQELRKSIISKMVILFCIANVFVFVALSTCFYFDTVMILEELIMPRDRLVSGQVVMTIVGATTVQLGTLIITAAGYLFPKNS